MKAKYFYFLGALLPGGGKCARGFTREEFAERARKFVNNELHPELFLALCNTILADESMRRNVSFEAEVYAFRAATYWKNREIEKARDDAQEAVRRNSGVKLAHQVLYNVYIAQKKYGSAARTLENLVAFSQCSSEKKRLGAMAKELRLRMSVLDAGLLRRAFGENELEANTKYGNTTLAVIGVVSGVTYSALGWPKLLLAGKSEIAPCVACLFGREARMELAEFFKGFSLTVAGSCMGLCKGHVLLKDCRILDR